MAGLLCWKQKCLRLDIKESRDISVGEEGDDDSPVEGHRFNITGGGRMAGRGVGFRGGELGRMGVGGHCRYHSVGFRLKTKWAQCSDATVAIS